MIYDKILITKYLRLSIFIKHTGKDNHERICCTEQAVRDFNKIIEDSVDYMNERIKSWERHYSVNIEQVGK